MSQAVNITTPVGRLVQGSLYTGKTMNDDGTPKAYKTGKNAGQPRTEYYIALAIPKGAEQHWSQTAWGAEIWRIGHTAYPQAAQAADFSWKVVDGDSAQPGKLYKGKPGKAPRENEGFPGHWVLKLTSSFPSNIYKHRDGGGPNDFDPFDTPGAVKLGYYIQVVVQCQPNEGQSPGVYLEQRMICFSAYGPEIFVGMDVSAAGFGNSALPPGATMTPPAGAFAGVAPGMAPNAPGLPPPPHIPATPALPPVAAPAPAYAPAAVGMPAPAMPAAPIAAPAPVAVHPNPAFVQVPAAAAPLPPGFSAPAPGVPAAPIAPAVRSVIMAGGQDYNAFRAAGWTDDMIVAQGHGQWSA